jgi:hypothetical protein
MYYAFLDTTALHKAYQLRGANWDSIQSAVSLGVARVATSTVTLLELDRQAGADAEAVKKQLEDAARALERFGGSLAVPGVPFDSLLWRSDFEARLGARGIEITSRANPTHDVVLGRDLGRQPPFKPSGEGYRDTLLWLSFLEWAASLGIAEGDSLYFVSANSTQFAEGGKKDGTLAKALVEECRTRTGFDATLLDNPQAFADIVRPAALAIKAKPSPAVPSGSQRLAIQTVVALAETYVDADVELSTPMTFQGISVDAAVPLPQIDNGSVQAIEVLSDRVDAQLVDTFDDTTEIWSVTVDAIADIIGPMLRADYAISRADVYIYDADWNDHYVIAGTELYLRLRFDVRVETIGESAEAELVDVSVLEGDPEP